MIAKYLWQGLRDEEVGGGLISKFVSVLQKKELQVIFFYCFIYIYICIYNMPAPLLFRSRGILLVCMCEETNAKKLYLAHVFFVCLYNIRNIIR